MSQTILTNDLESLLSSLGIDSSENIYVTGNISKLARTRLSKIEILNAIDSSLWNVIGEGGTIFSPAASMNLCNTTIPFDLNKTKSHEMGPLAEFLRKKTNSLRSFHPFWSVSGNGKNSEILNDVSRHSYGAFSPWSYFLDLDVRQVNFGLHPANAVTLIHHIETIVGVPYRYTKEFLHPVLRNGIEKIEPFYMSVMYKNADVVKRYKLNQHYFEKLNELSQIRSVKHSSGIEIWSFKMKDFFSAVKPFFIRDIYNYLEHSPAIRPYQN
tara:strand:+ start:10001 stop:10807 length:807 start_codon:yes stop_codon:yes gene_type:complete